MKELKDHIEDLNRDFNSLKEYNDEKFKDLEDRSMSRPELDERLDKITKGMDATQGKIDELQTKLNRPSLGDVADEQQEKVDAHKAAFSKYLRKGHHGLSPTESKTLSEGVGSQPADGGPMAPNEFIRELLRRLTNSNPIRQVCDVKTGQAKSIEIPARTVNLACDWVAEAATTSATQPTYALNTIAAFKLSALTPVTVELLEDAYFDVEAELTTDFAEAFADKEGEGILLGTGSGQPEGVIVNSDVPVVQDASTTTAVITAPTLIDAFYTLKGGYAANATWAMNMGTQGSLRGLTDDEGQYLWQPGLTGASPSTLLGRPIIVCDGMAALASDSKSIVVGDFKGYTVYDRLGMSVLRDDYTSAADGIVRFIAHRRTGGLTTDPSAFVVVQAET